MAILFQQADIPNAANNATALSVGGAVTTAIIAASANITATGNNSIGIDLTSGFCDLLVRGTVVGSSSGIFSDENFQQVTVAEGGLVSGATGINLQSDSNYVTVNGEVHGNNTGIYLSGSANSVTVNSVVTGFIGVQLYGEGQVTNTGTISGAVGLSMTSSSTDEVVVANSGTISGANGPAVDITAALATIGNSGTIISAGDLAIELESNDITGVIRLVNSGDIVTEGFRTAIELSKDVEATEVGRAEIINAGLIQGDVVLDANADSYDGEGGRLIGTLFAGGGNDTISGGSFSDRFEGGAGEDEIEGNAGDDRISGGAGADLLNGGAGLDWLVYAGSTFGVNVNLNTGEATGGDATGDEISGFERLLGSNLSDTVFGSNAAADTLDGAAGNDVLSGQIGNDRIFGRVGNDTLEGGAGADQLYGGADADQFRYRALGDSTVAWETRDRIKDFSQAQGDKISLSLIDAVTGGGDDAFAFIGNGAFTGVAGQLRYVVTGATTRIEGTVDANTTADFAITLNGVYALVAADFIL